MADLARIKRNVSKMASMNAPVADIDNYISSEGVTVNDIRNFTPVVKATPSATERMRSELDYAPEAVKLFQKKTPTENIKETALSALSGNVPGGLFTIKKPALAALGAGLVEAPVATMAGLGLSKISEEVAPEK